MDLRDELSAFYYSTALCELKLMNSGLDDGSISYNSLMYLEIIYSMHGRCTPARLSRMLNISKPGVTAKINELERMNLIVRTPDPEDGRQVRLAINEEALPKYRIYRRQDEEAIRTITERFSKEDVEKFSEMLRIMTEINYRESGL